MFASVRRLTARLRPPAEATDAALLARFTATGDDEAFAALLGRHGGMVFGVCRHLTASHHDAEDAFQAAFLVLATRADTVRPPDRLGAWLHGVAVNVARKARRPLVGPGVPDVAAPGLRPVEPDDLDALHAEVVRLPDRYRLPVVLCHLEGRSRREAADALGWPEGTVSGRLARGLVLLRDRLGRRGVGLPAAVTLTVLPPGQLVAQTLQSAALVAAGVTPVPVHLVPLTRGVLPTVSVRTLLAVSAVAVCGAAGVVAVPADPPPVPAPAPAPPAARPAPHWVEVAKASWPIAVTQLTFFPQGLFIAGSDGSLTHWNTDAGWADLKLRGGQYRAFDRVRLDAAGRHLFSITMDGKFLWRVNGSDLSDGQGVSCSDKEFLSVSPDGQSILYRLEGRPKVFRVYPNLGWVFVDDSKAAGAEFDHDVRRAAMSPDNKWLAIALANKTVHMVARDGLKEGAILPVAGGPAVDLVFSPDSARLAVVEPAGTVTLFAHGTGAKLATLAGHTGGTTAVAFHPDGNLVATAGADKMVRLWDAGTGRPGAVLRGHTDTVTGVAFGPDGKRLASGSADRTVRVWEFRR